MIKFNYIPIITWLYMGMIGYLINETLYSFIAGVALGITVSYTCQVVEMAREEIKRHKM